MASLDLVDGTVPSEVRFVTTDHLATAAALTYASRAQFWERCRNGRRFPALP